MKVQAEVAAKKAPQQTHWVLLLLDVMVQAAEQYDGHKLEFDCDANSKAQKVFVRLSVDGGEFAEYKVIEM